jgi:hypothetical protein
MISLCAAPCESAYLDPAPGQDVVPVENVLFITREPRAQRLVVLSGLHTTTYVEWKASTGGSR